MEAASSRIGIIWQKYWRNDGVRRTQPGDLWYHCMHTSLPRPTDIQTGGGGPRYRSSYQPTTVLKLPYRGTFQTCTHTDMVFYDIGHSCLRASEAAAHDASSSLAHARKATNWTARRGVFQSWGTSYEKLVQDFGDFPAQSADINVRLRLCHSVSRQIRP